jgi:uncharacterized MAPEG superfamily protein
VIVAQQTHAVQATLNLMAIAFIITRLVYVGCYFADLAVLRTLVWTAGFLLTIAIFLLGAF